MQAVVLRAPRDLGLERVAAPAPGNDEVLLRVTHGGICGTDYSLYTGAMPAAYPRILGHEIVADVEVSHSAHVAGGQRVLVDPALSCGRCFCCRAGLTNLCPAAGLIGRETDGGFAEFVAVPSRHVFVLPPAIDSRTAPLIQVLTTCYHAQRFIDILPAQCVVVTGLGVSGQLHVQLARARGARPVIGVSRSAWKRGLAERLGADVTMSTGPDVPAAVRETTGGLGADVVIECTGKTTVIAQAVEMARPGGTILLFGTSTESRSELSFYQMYFKELKLVNSRAAKAEDFPASIALVAGGAVKLEPLVTHVLPMPSLGEAIGLMGGDADERLKIVLENTW
jgi:2-desacetyl-2-hydroxyethyl bacteriochlorophyllide A dehydrogenase